MFFAAVRWIRVSCFGAVPFCLEDLDKYAELVGFDLGDTLKSRKGYWIS